MPRPPPDPALVRRVLDRCASGASPSEVAAELARSGTQLSLRTIQGWVQRYGEAEEASPPALVAPPPVAPAPPDPPEEVDDDDATTLDRMRRMLSDLRRDAAAARKRGNTKDAQRTLRDSVALSATIVRLERAQQADGGAVHASRAEIEAALQRHRDNVRQLCERPLLCADCGRALSIKWGQGQG